MEPHFLFFTGEPALTLPLLKQRPQWSPVLSALRFSMTNGRLHRAKSASDDFRGVVYFADVHDKDIERHNLHLFSSRSVPCWPDPAALLELSDRHFALAKCRAAGLVDHSIVISGFTRQPLLPLPYVLKVGDEHRGEGKYLIRNAADIPSWEGEATAEPFFEGESVRVLLLGDRAFGLRIVNDTHWIKNSAGGRIEVWEPDSEIVAHARRARALFRLDVAGIDYVIDGTGFHFIELNPFPRLGMTKESAALAQNMLGSVMERIEAKIGR